MKILKLSKTICLLFFLLLNNPVIAQESKKEIEEFVNTFIADQISKEFKYFNLIDSSYLNDLSLTFSFESYLKGINQSISTFPNTEFTTKNVHSKILDWKNFKLKKAKIYNKQTIPRFYSQVKMTITVSNKLTKRQLAKMNNSKKYYEYIVPIDSTWTKERKREEIDDYKAKADAKIAKEDKIAYRFSTTIFSKNKNYVVIFMDTDEKGTIFAYKKVNDKWIQIFKERTWIV